MLELKDDRERAGKATMSFTSAAKTAAVQLTLRVCIEVQLFSFLFDAFASFEVVFVKDLKLYEGHLSFLWTLTNHMTRIFEPRT